VERIGGAEEQGVVLAAYLSLVAKREVLAPQKGGGTQLRYEELKANESAPMIFNATSLKSPMALFVAASNHAACLPVCWR